MIKIFGCFVSPQIRVCGIDLNVLSYRKKEAITDYLADHACDQYDDGAMEIVFLQEAGILNRTGIYVKGIDGSEVETRIKEASLV